MSDRAMSEAAMLASLRDIDLPAESAGGLIAEIAVTVGLAGLAALMLAGLLRVFSQRRRKVRAPTLQQRLAATRALPEADRRVALLHMLRDRAPERYAEVAAHLYRPDRPVSADRLEGELERLV